MSRNRLLIIVIGILTLAIAIGSYILNYVLLMQRFERNATQLGLSPTPTQAVLDIQGIASSYQLVVESMHLVDEAHGATEQKLRISPSPTPFNFVHGRCHPIFPLDDLADIKARRQYVIQRRGDKRPHYLEVLYEKSDNSWFIIERSRILDASGKTSPWQIRRYACDAEKRVWVFDEQGNPLGEYLSLKPEMARGDTTWIRGWPYFADSPAFCRVIEVGPFGEAGRDFLLVAQLSCEEKNTTRILFFAPGVGVIGWREENEEVFLER